MGDDALIIEGIDSSEAKASLYSTVHGAGRLFGRKEAKHRFSAPKWIPGCKPRGVTLVGADLDESPMAYRRLPKVLAHYADSVHAAPVRGRHGGRRRIRPVQGPLGPTGGHYGKLCRPPSWCRFFQAMWGGLPQFRCKLR
jgi:hypothetical protein